MNAFTCLDVVRAAGLKETRKSGREHLYLCPKHEDRDPSLKINKSKDVFMCGPCNAKGNAWALAAFLSEHAADDKPAVRAWLVERGLLASNGNGAHSSTRTRSDDDVWDRPIAATYAYRDERGILLYENVRFTPKAFRARRPNGSGWIKSIEGVERVPYALDRLADSTPDLFVVEGEKDAEVLWAQGVPATTNVFGAGKWDASYSQRLARVAGVHRAYIIPDHDAPGHKHAADVAASLHAAQIEAHILSIPGLHDGAPPPNHGRDLSDWLSLHSIDELKALAAAAPVWMPTPPPTPSHWQFLDLADVHAWECDPLQPIVDGMIARNNYVVISAETQTGKTLIALYLTRKLIKGGTLFDKFAVTPVDRLLYLVLEDPNRRIKDRLLDLDREGDPAVARGRCIFGIVPGFNLTDEQANHWAWLEYQIEHGRYDVVILDTYQRATPGINSFDDEKQSLIVHRLAILARRFGVTLIVIDHVRKQSSGPARRRGDLTIDDLKGTGGKVQNADCVILMERTPDKRSIKFQSFSKDFDQPVRILLNVAPRGSHEPKFTYAGDLGAREDNQALAAQRRAAILTNFPAGWVTRAEIAARTGNSKRTLDRDLPELIKLGHVIDNGQQKKARRYQKVNAPTECANEIDGLAH